MSRPAVPEDFIQNIIAPACENDEAVMEAFRKTPRRKFMDEAIHRSAYKDDALPIGYGQTISKPSTVAFMTKELNLEPSHTVLEIGTGSGFQAAILSRIAGRVYTVERISELYHRALSLLRRMFILNVKFKLDDGTLGWPDNAPFDRILAACETTKVPDELVNQLAENGRMLIPVNGKIVLYVKENGELTEKPLRDCRFVDFVSETG